MSAIFQQRTTMVVLWLLASCRPSAPVSTDSSIPHSAVVTPPPTTHVGDRSDTPAVDASAPPMPTTAEQSPAPKPAFDWLSGPMPKDFQIDFAIDCSSCREAPERVALGGESRLFVQGAQRCLYRCGTANSGELRALWQKLPLSDMAGLGPLHSEEQIEDLWSFQQVAFSVLRLRANGQDYRLAPYSNRYTDPVQAWLRALSRLSLHEHACPELHIGHCHAYRADQPLGMRLQRLEMRAEPYFSEDAKAVLAAIQDSVWACVGPRIKRERFRSAFTTLTLELSLTSAGKVKALSGLTPSMLRCVRESASQWQLPSLPRGLEFQVTYVVEEYCDVVRDGVVAAHMPCFHEAVRDAVF